MLQKIYSYFIAFGRNRYRTSIHACVTIAATLQQRSKMMEEKVPEADPISHLFPSA
jgi:hypothetical protein